MAFTSVSANVTQAINFLTMPLILTQNTELVASVQSILRTTLPATILPRDGQATLSFSPTSLPPRPILAACIACDLLWADWMTLLGNRDFDLTIEAHDVLVTYFDLSRPYTITIWSEPTPTPTTGTLLSKLNLCDEPIVPISKLGQQSARHASLKVAVDSARARAQTRTLAQQLLEVNHQQEADEIFDMISKSCIISPTPTRERFPALAIPTLTTTFASPLSSPEVMSPADSVSSRPSSRSSTFSSYSFSDDESVTSASSIASFDFLASTLKKTPAQPLNKNSPAFVPRLAPTKTPAERAPIVDTSKADKTKYLYQGGVTTVVTGGVMLGAPSASSSAPAQKQASAVPKYRAPIGGRNKFPAQSVATNTKTAAASAQSWRRAPRV